MNKLTIKQKAFCEHYASTGNATKSAIVAGYPQKTAKSIGQRLLTKVDVRNYLDSLLNKQEKKRIMTAVERQEWLSDVIRGEIKDCHVTSDGQVIERRIRVSDRIRAAELLARMRGELLDRHRIDGEIRLTRIKKRYDGE